MSIAEAKFGPGGNGNWFISEGHKKTEDMPAWLAAKGLDAYEYEAGQGVVAGEASLKKIGEEARKYGILMSLHSPYFISLSGVEVDKRMKSLDYIEKSVWASELLGADIIVIHSGSAGKISREEAMRLSCDTLYHVAEKLGDRVRASGIRLGIETMGKQNQLGNLDEVIEQCKVADCFYPVVDFGHLNARDCGGIFTDADSYRRVFDRISDRLDAGRARTVHCHFSKIMYTDKGEKKHLTFEDSEYGPEFEPLMEAIARDGLAPRIICESDGTMPEDALSMKKLYMSIKNN